MASLFSYIYPRNEKRALRHRARRRAFNVLGKCGGAGGGVTSFIESMSVSVQRLGSLLRSADALLIVFKRPEYCARNKSHASLSIAQR